jgi:RimJ/RimL family protein N-acetyltransferase
MTSITTERLVLRPLAAGDAAAIVRGLNNFAVSRWLARVPYPYGPDDAESFLNRSAMTGPDLARFAILHEGEFIGCIGIEEGKMGYWLAEPAWGRGFGREAARAAAAHAFGAMALERLKAGYFIGNEGSRRILEGLGFEETGRGPKFSLAHNGELPHVGLALTRGRWKRTEERR